MRMGFATSEKIETQQIENKKIEATCWLSCLAEFTNLLLNSLILTECLKTEIQEILHYKKMGII